MVKIEENKPYVEYNYLTGHFSQVIESINRTIGQYKRNHTILKTGITGRNPKVRFTEHLKDLDWDKMIVIYETTSEDYLRDIEKKLVENHKEDLINEIGGGGGLIKYDATTYYLYILVQK